VLINKCNPKDQSPLLAIICGAESEVVCGDGLVLGGNGQK
jgi:hypothetical protein